MAILFAGSAVDDFNELGIDTTVTTATNIANGVNEGVYLSANDFVSCSFAGTANLNLSFYANITNGFPNTDTVVIEMISTDYSNTQPVARVILGGRGDLVLGTGNTAVETVEDGNTEPVLVEANAEMFMTLQNWDDSSNVWVDVAHAAENTAITATDKYDIQLGLDNANGFFNVFYEKLPFVEYSGDTIYGSYSSINKIKLYSLSDSSNTFLSSVIVADANTVNYRLLQVNLSESNNTVDFEGNTDVLFASAINDNNYIESANVVNEGDTLLFNLGVDAGEIGNSDIVGYVISARAKFLNPEASPSLAGGFNMVFNDGNTTVEVVSNNEISDAFANYTFVQDTNPFTNTNFTIADFDTTQAGIRSFKL